jgi:archaeal cell division control protein 6
LAEIFRNKDLLSPRFVPEHLAHRQDALSELDSIFANSLQAPEKSNLQTVQLVGPPGSGKTSCIQVFGRELEESALKSRVNLKHLYVNLKLHAGRRAIFYRHLCESLSRKMPIAGMGAEELLTQLVRYLREKEMYLLLSLDDLDYWLQKTKDTTILYDLTRLNEIDPGGGSSNVLGIIFVSRTTEFYQELDPAELSTLGRIPIRFKPYTINEIADILLDRISGAFHPSAINESVIDFVAKIASAPPSNGDARYALDLLLHAGNYAERSGADGVLPEHVRYVVEQLHPTFTQEDVLNLPSTAHALALMAVAIALRSNRKTYATLKEIRQEASLLEKNRGATGLVEDLEDYLKELAEKRMVEISSLEIGINGVSTERLTSFLDMLFLRLERRS